MGKIYNRENKKLFLGMLFLLLIVLCIGNLAQGAVIRRQRNADQQMFAAFFGNVKALYPEVREEEWIALLNSTKHLESGRELLASYGILEGQESFAMREHYFRQGELWMNGCLLFFFLAVVLLLSRFFYRRQSRLDGLALYLQKVSKGEYMLEPEEQREDELSALQSELYKVVVLLREQAARLQEQKKALADSVADISHQLKTPLTSMMVLVDNLSESNHMEEATRRHFLAEITAQLGGMAWLVATMLKLSRLDAGVVELEHRDFSVRQLLRQVAEGLEQQAEWRDVSVEVETEEDAVIRGDVKWLKEALMNIVKNGIEHSPEQGRVLITMRDNAVYTEVAVRNFGDVLSGEEQKHIFERFYNGKTQGSDNVESADKDKTRQSRRAGFDNAGIGLALAKEIIEKQNGYIGVESTKENGTVFTIKFMKTIS